MQIIATIIRANPVRGGMGGPNWYSLVVSGGKPICSFRQFLAKTYRFARIQNVTDRRQTDRQTNRRHAVAKARPIIRSAKNQSIFGEETVCCLVFLTRGVFYHWKNPLNYSYHCAVQYLYYPIKSKKLPQKLTKVHLLTT